MKINEDPLDNPVWHALTDIHFDKNIDYGNVKFYKTDYTPFGACFNNADTAFAIEKHSQLIDEFFIVGSPPNMPKNFKPPIKYVGNQMIIYNKINYPITETIVKLNKTHYTQLMDLVKLAYPEYFKSKTNTLGSYYGIFKDKKLVAITGERFQTENFIEISAVITHPDFRRNSFAKQLISHAANTIFMKNKIPFLHVDITNIEAIALYKKLGFTIRRELEFWKIYR